MVNVDALLKNALETLQVPVARLHYSGDASSFIVYQLVTGLEADHSDDDVQATEFTYMVNLYTKGNYINLLQSIRTALRGAGFYGVAIEAEIYEQDTGYYHVPLTLKYMEV